MAERGAMMNKKLKEKINEAFSSVLPITLIVLLLSVLLSMSIDIIVMFLMGAVLLIVGVGLFSLGVEMSTLPMGEGIGVEFSKSKKLWLIVALCFFLGFAITVAEPDLQVLARQVNSIDSLALIASVAAGVGIFLAIAVLRIMFKIKLSYLLLGFYSILFLISFFTPVNFISVAFDSGGVTTGPITVPFILALGFGVASSRSGKDSNDDSFGLVALCSIGPVLAVLALGFIYNPHEADYSPVVLPEIQTTSDVVREFAMHLPGFLREILLAMAPIAVFFIGMQIVTRRYKKRQLARMSMGFVYTMLGLVLFLTGVNVGFIPAGNIIGSLVAASSFEWLLIPIGMLVGYFIVAAEPAVHVLNRQVEDVTGGTISRNAINTALSIGVAVSLALAMIRVLTGISIFWMLAPGYLISLGLTFFVPKMFTGIAFDSGGVVSGPMTTTFLLPFAMGACEALGGNVLTDAFGIVAMVAMTPLITIQTVGLMYKIKLKKVEAADIAESSGLEDPEEIIEYEEDAANE